MQKLHLWQEFDCPHGSDSDIEEPNLLHQGQKFYCHWCGGEHTAGVDVQVSTTRDWREYLDLPQSAEALKALTDQETAPRITEEELHALRKKVATYEARDALGLVPQPAGARGPDGKEWAKTAAGYAHVEAMLTNADGHHNTGPYWYGWALRGAFVAGAEWQEARNPHAPAITYLPLTLAEARDLTCMLAGAPWPDEMLPELQQLLGIYDGLRAHGQRPVDPATLPRKVAKAVMKTGLLPATPQQPAPSAAAAPDDDGYWGGGAPTKYAPQLSPTPQADSQPAPDCDLSATTDEDLMVIAVVGLNSARFRINKGDCAGALEVVNKARDACIVAGERASARAARAPADSVTAPAQQGKWTWAPVEPSTAMLVAGNHGQPGDFSALKVWQDMLGALERSFDYTRPIDPPSTTPPAQAADSVLKDAARLEQIAEAIRDYHHALDLRKHGGLAESAAFNSICQTMGMPWNQGEEAARRAATQQGGA